MAPKLTDEQVLEIRRKYAEGPYTQEMLAVEYGVSQRAISGYVRGATRQKSRSVSRGEAGLDQQYRKEL